MKGIVKLFDPCSAAHSFTAAGKMCILKRQKQIFTIETYLSELFGICYSNSLKSCESIPFISYLIKTTKYIVLITQIRSNYKVLNFD